MKKILYLSFYFEPDVTASEMEKFGKFTSKALKRFNIEKKKEGKPVTEHSIDMRKNLQDEN